MLYVKITGTIIFVMCAVLTVSSLEYALVVISGLLAKSKKYPKREEKLRYGIIICARNEEMVIAQLIESIRKCNYPQDKIDIFVMAHNCTDNTAKVSRECGYESFVYEYNNDKEKTKGYALKKVFQYIERDYGIKNYDGFHIFDADNILDKEYMNKMNDAFLYYDKKHAITSFRNAKNFGTNVQTACYGLTYIMCCPIESNGRMALKGCARILGSGFLVSAEMVKDGWNIVNLSDDTDFTIEQVLDRHNVKYCDEAMYYDEHPTKLKSMWRQRLRWAKGALIVCNKRFCSLWKTSFGKTKDGERPHRGSAFDLLCTLIPIGALGVGITLLDIIFKSFIPIFGIDPTIIWIKWAVGFFGGIILGYFGGVLLATIFYIKERKRIKNVTRKVKVLSVFAFPLFTMLLAPLQLVSIFSRGSSSWTQIEHSDQANFSMFNENTSAVASIENNVETKNIKIVDKETNDLEINEEKI